jgi:hypothetical protein
MIPCVDGYRCHIAAWKKGVPPCEKQCGIRASMLSSKWYRVLDLARSGNKAAKEVIRRAQAVKN